MKQIKKYIVKILNKYLRHTEVYSRLESIQVKLNQTINLQQLLIPEVLPFQKKAERIFNQVNVNFNFSKTNLEISKNDLMFMFWLYQTGSVEVALTGYFKSGILQADCIRKFIETNFIGRNDIQILDFASGHGRVSRYFSNFISRNQVTVSDIKENAVNFQNNIFNYNVFVAPADPVLMPILKKFDYIIVSSLFTHLNENLFSDWIRALGLILNVNGVLAVSLHIIETGNANEFRYSEKSEDDLFPETEESLGGKNIYGLTHITRDVYYSILEKNLGSKYSVIDEQDWAGSQRLISIRKESA